MEIRHPEWLQIKTDDRILYGFSQEWYKTSFRRTRGCGPTAAAMLLLYLNQRESGPLPYDGSSISSAATALEDVWNDVTPGWLLGLNSTEKFRKGVEALLGRHGVGWRCQALGVKALGVRRPPLAEVVKFLEEGIASDCPVAFLNLDKGRAEALDSWHWIVVVAMSQDPGRNRYTATCYDGGRRITFDLGLWLETTRFGGGFAYITV
ncbi:MAG: hypothetical protein P4N41_00945 [Negativicutes bacterium]|nr:hypothetical protein [Negativicutes bacterium]